MTDLTLTTSEKFLIGEIFSMPDKKVGWSFLRKSARHMTIVGYRRVMDKMERRNLIARSGEGDEVQLTFNGVRAARALGWEE